VEGLFDDPTLPGNDARLGLTLELPFFGRRGAAQAAAAARVAAARASAEAVRVQVTGAAAAARRRYLAARELVRALEDTVVPAQRAAAELAAAGYREGQTGVVVVMEAQRGLAEAQADAIEAHADAAAAYVELTLATGGEL
jgi:outer membrane protein TolC